MSKSINIRFDAPKKFETSEFLGLEKICGLYFIMLTQRSIAYPFGDSKLIYIGMSERTTNSILTRLGSHLDGTSGNLGISNFKKVDALRFTYLNFDVLRSFWSQRIEDLESYFLQDFVKSFGVYPICNNKTGFPDFDNLKNSSLTIDWHYFGGQGERSQNRI